MNWIKEVYSDEKLFQSIALYPVKKYIQSTVAGVDNVEIFDDPICGSDLWDIQVCS